MNLLQYKWFRLDKAPTPSTLRHACSYTNKQAGNGMHVSFYAYRMKEDFLYRIIIYMKIIGCHYL